MYPYAIIGDIDLYAIFLACGICAALVVFRIASDISKIGTKLFNFTLVLALFSVTSGYFFSVFFQALFNIKSRGAFIIDSQTGATFAGGAIGGAAVFILLYFIFGKKFDDNYKSSFAKIADCAACAIPAGHSLGRVGCLMAGCCYGKEAPSPLGVYMQSIDCRVLPVQLYEAVFLAALAVFLVLSLKNGKKHQLCAYLFSYGIWRFFIEFLRDDYRGEIFGGVLSPSQFISVLFVGSAALIYIIERKRDAEV